ncbi:hypothetical protein SAMN02745181_2586 [Rubritalea squalenifaciens DSM 18772]|uniref:Uncharacterized protein n=2 Tax=Rubritalea TaxID=361050 RepID=A0A1M6M3A3_9BACT|nr:erythromycin esterase family protein [Rubritalea squalenifaciens]SHJ77870.1 hypothetical protein SAMN02745181_2586 [Rubritalea squalenifaciens DSM 18772]
MICIVGNMPVLQIGRHQVSGYDTRCIHSSIEKAADRAGLGDFAFVDDVYDGVIHYLEKTCPLRLLRIEELYERVRHMLKRIGYASIAFSLEPEAPAVTISLERAARDAGLGFELAFFKELQEELNELKGYGASEVYFCDIESCVRILKQCEDWNEDCAHLEADILDWLQKVGTQPERQGYRIRANVRNLSPVTLP